MFKKIPKKILILLTILIIASFFRLYNLSGPNSVPPGLYPDEAMNGNNALEALSSTPSVSEFKIFYPENNGREGLFINIQALFIKMLGNEPWVLRLPSAVFGILTVLGVYLAGSTLFNNASIGLLSSFFTAISFWHINFSRIGLRAIIAPFFLVWAIYFLILAIKKNHTTNKPLKNNHPSWLLAAFGGLIYGAGFYSYIAYRATPLLILAIFLIYWFKNDKKKDIWEVFRIFLIFTAIAILPLTAYFIANPQDFLGRTTQISIFNSCSPFKDLGSNFIKTLVMFNFSGDTNWRHNFEGQPELYWPIGVLFIIGILYGIQNLIKKTNREFIIIFSWLIVAAVPVIISNEGIPHALRSILMIPPIFILAGIGAYKIYESIINTMPGFCHKHDRLLKNAFILICICLIIQSYNYYFLKWGKNPNTEYAFRQNYVDLGKIINALPQNTIKYIVTENSDIRVRNIPMPAQTIMFITDTFSAAKQINKNIYYIMPGQENDRCENNALFFYIK